MHYMKWTRVMLPEVSEEFELACILLLFFFFLLSLSISKRSALSKIQGDCSPPSRPGFDGHVYSFDFYKFAKILSDANIICQNTLDKSPPRYSHTR